MCINTSRSSNASQQSDIIVVIESMVYGLTVVAGYNVGGLQSIITGFASYHLT